MKRRVISRNDGHFTWSRFLLFMAVSAPYTGCRGRPIARGNDYNAYKVLESLAKSVIGFHSKVLN